MAGPDGIPYACWRQLGTKGIEVPWNTIEGLQDADGKELLEQAHKGAEGEEDGDRKSFNQATMISLPEK